MKTKTFFIAIDVEGTNGMPSRAELANWLASRLHNDSRPADRFDVLGVNVWDSFFDLDLDIDAQVPCRYTRREI